MRVKRITTISPDNKRQQEQPQSDAKMLPQPCLRGCEVVHQGDGADSAAAEKYPARQGEGAAVHPPTIGRRRPRRARCIMPRLPVFRENGAAAVIQRGGHHLIFDGQSIHRGPGRAAISRKNGRRQRLRPATAWLRRLLSRLPSQRMTLVEHQSAGLNCHPHNANGEEHQQDPAPHREIPEPEPAPPRIHVLGNPTTGMHGIGFTGESWPARRPGSAHVGAVGPCPRARAVDPSLAPVPSA